MPQNRILLGVIGRPHGVRGLVRVTSHTADPAGLTAYGPLSDDKGRRFVLRWRGEGVAEVGEQVGDAAVKVADRNAAEKLTNTRLYVDRAQLPEPEAEEFYLADLIGMTAVGCGRRRAGTGRRRCTTMAPARAWRSRGMARRRVLVPFTRACVPEVDLAGEAGRSLAHDLTSPTKWERSRRAATRVRVIGSARCISEDACRARSPSPSPLSRLDLSRSRGRGCRRAPPDGSAMTWRASVLTLFPEMFPGPLAGALAGRALSRGIWSLDPVNIRDFATDRHRSVDDTPFGGGPGMVMRPDVIDAALASAAGDRPLRVPHPARPPLHPGRRTALRRRPWPDPAVRPLRGRRPARHRRSRDGGSLDRRLRAVRRRTSRTGDARRRRPPAARRDGCGRQRHRGKFLRHLLEYPHYTRPAEWQGRRVPEVLLSGHHQAVAAWRRAEAERITRERRPDLWAAVRLRSRRPGCQPSHGAVSKAREGSRPMNIVQQFEAARDRPPAPGPRRAGIPGRATPCASA